MTEKELPMLVVTSKVKEYIQEQGGKDIRMQGEMPAALNEAVCVLVKHAIERCIGRGAKTVSANDV